MSERAVGFGMDRRDVLVTATLLALGGYALGSIVTAVVASLVAVGGVDLSANPVQQLIVATLAIQGITFLGGSLLFLHVTDRWDLLRVRLPTARDLALVGLGFVLLVGSFFVFDLVYDALGIPSAESSIVETARANPPLLLYLVPLSLLVVGPGEELLYRGLVQGWLRQSFSPAVAVVVTSLLFASIHLAGYIGAPPVSIVSTLAIIAFLALYLGALYEYSGNLLVPALVHGLYNASQFLLAYGQVTNVF